MKKIIITIMFVVLGFASVLPTSTDAATKTTTMYVNAKSDIVLRTKPAQQADRIGTIKNHSKIEVYSSANGWSHVYTGKYSGYVYSSALTKKNPKATVSPTIVTKGLTPVNGLVLTYSPGFGVDKSETYHAVKDEDGTHLYTKKNLHKSYGSDFIYIEDADELVMGVSYSDFIFVNLVYPLKQGTYITGYFNDQYNKFLVESTTKTIKVKAGSFKNTVILRYANGSRHYFAKGIGMIKATNANGKTTVELASYKATK